jgi:thiol-disulfide isomerase/thioredoxin
MLTPMATATGRVRAPELRGAGGWINTAAPLTLADLRGRVVLLDFWTFCCINCLRVIEELRPLEERFGDRLVVVGVHSPKFPHESDHAAVERAVRRHRVEHPVLDDPEMETWQRYGVRAWPTLVVIDPDGYVVASAAGEGNGAAIGDFIARLLDEYSEQRGPSTTAPPELWRLRGRPSLPRTADAAGEVADHGAPLMALGPQGLSYPGKVVSDGAARLAVADTGHDRVLVCDLAGVVTHVFDGLHQPQGVRFDGDALLVCDTVAGELLSIDLPSGQRRVLATGLRSPWDVLRLRDGRIAVAEAGLHRLVAVSDEDGEISVLAGTRAEGLRDGPAELAHLAQPSGLTLLADGAIAFADSEVSALRVVRDGSVATLVGRGLFEWGSNDGDASAARLQHPLGVAALPDGAIAIADTFNSLLRVWRDDRLSTIHLDEPLSEPGGLDVLPGGGGLVVADTNHHRVVRVDPATGAVRVLPITVGGAMPAEGAPLHGTTGTPLALTVDVDLGGLALDGSQGPPVRVLVNAEPESLLADGEHRWSLTTVPATIDLPLGGVGDGWVTVDVIASACQDDLCTIRRDTRRHRLSVV